VLILCPATAEIARGIGHVGDKQAASRRQPGAGHTSNSLSAHPADVRRRRGSVAATHDASLEGKWVLDQRADQTVPAATAASKLRSDNLDDLDALFAQHVAGSEKMPAPTTDPTTIAVSMSGENLCSPEAVASATA
jgi:hypothetical protein